MEGRGSPPQGEITRLVAAWSSGTEGAFEELMEVVYDDLKRIAHHHLELGSRDGEVNTTVLVHEAYLRLARAELSPGLGRAQFFAFCSKAMRRLLIDFARRRSAAKRGGMRVRIPLSEDTASLEDAVEEILAVDEALSRLEARSPRMARIAECRFFGGMSVPETAEALDTSPRTVEREWARARVYLQATLGGGSSPVETYP